MYCLPPIRIWCIICINPHPSVEIWKCITLSASRYCNRMHFDNILSYSSDSMSFIENCWHRSYMKNHCQIVTKHPQWSNWTVHMQLLVTAESNTPIRQTILQWHLMSTILILDGAHSILNMYRCSISWIVDTSPEQESKTHYYFHSVGKSIHIHHYMPFVKQGCINNIMKHIMDKVNLYSIIKTLANDLT